MGHAYGLIRDIGTYQVWLGDSRHIVLHSDWRTRREVLVIDTEARGTDAIRRLRVPAPLDTVRIPPALPLVHPSRLRVVPSCASLSRVSCMYLNPKP